MLDSGTLSRRDLEIGSDLPNLGPNIHCPEDMQRLVNHFEQLNAVASSNSIPLTRCEAHSFPAESEATFEQELQAMFLQEMNAASATPAEDEDDDDDEPPDLPDGDSDTPPPTPIDIEDDGTIINEEVTVLVSEPLEDVIDPFYRDDDRLDGPSTDISVLAPHLLCIYALVTWLHLQFHLPRIACNAVLAALSYILLSIAPELDSPYVTLKAANHALGLDIPTHTLPVCPHCREVYPASSATPSACVRCDAELFISDRTQRGRKRQARMPLVRCPYLSISQQLPSILGVPGTAPLLDKWRKAHRVPGLYQDIFDGRICRELKAPDGTPFFSNTPAEHENGPNGELRIGLTLGADCILAGPKEQTPDEIQRFLRPIVSDLIRLWRDGIRIATPECPEGRLVRVILVAVVCDKPAAHKLAGFGSHSHTQFCTNCTITQKDKASPSAWTKGAFPARTNAEQRRLGEEYNKLTNKAARENFVKANATRYTQLSRLPYFDLVKQTVIDPMHNLFLGLVKTHFYNIWVQGKILRPNHELRVLHDMLAQFEIPATCGKLPKDIGTPAGGSLTADQWQLLAVVFGPIIIPQLWSACLPSNSGPLLHDRVTAIAKASAVKQAKKDKADVRLEAQTGANVSDNAADYTLQNMSQDATTGPEETAEELPFRLHPDDPKNFLKLSTALTILTKWTISDVEIDEADRLLREYCSELPRLYGAESMKPNHHYATHVPEYVRDFGPPHEFWTFLFERLNKILKSFNTNNHGNGELECTFFQEFQRTCQSARVTGTLAQYPGDSLERQVATVMLKASNDERGTIAALKLLSEELDEAGMDGRSIPLEDSAIFYDYVVLNGKRYHASEATGMHRTSMVEVDLKRDNGSIRTEYGELLEIFEYDQKTLGGPIWLGRIRWFVPWTGARDPVWSTLYVLNHLLFM
ncbi:hypothetical protein NEOLEDRAFT_1081034 [Neolentinus lepideus HHB14362 ss-1]|uniref:Transposase family Tnp2 protein n=1 Tax=Neolentinus lepideus HHB14362 ss-1 TaxID=1314782 RepID=A0A165M9V3_9AGAM|nr:hypothetical protein NEOLEDRAFT_1081034 [Neolentinus lepideus HHB14362 ss-1]